MHIAGLVGWLTEKKTWKKQNDKQFNKQNIDYQECPGNNSEMKKQVARKIRSVMWANQLGRKKAYYVKEFNPTYEHDNKEYLGAKIKGKVKNPNR